MLIFQINLNVSVFLICQPIPQNDANNTVRLQAPASKHLINNNLKHKKKLKPAVISYAKHRFDVDLITHFGE